MGVLGRRKPGKHVNSAVNAFPVAVLDVIRVRGVLEARFDGLGGREIALLGLGNRIKPDVYNLK
jgi:hypothetical protein